MAAAEERFIGSEEHPDSGWLMPFPTEADAVEYVVRRLTPYCTRIVREPEIGEGLRPDLGVRISGLPDVPIAIELKRFTANTVWPFAEAVRQAASYARRLNWAVFIGPLAGKGASKFDWKMSRLGTPLLIAGQFGVGGLYFAHERYRDRPCGGLLLAGAQIASFKRNENGEPEVEIKSDAVHLLTLKHGHGSKSWRP